MTEKPKPRANNGALFVGAGIFLSRIAGLVRERIFAHYFGNSAAGDAFKAALKIPNFLQNLLGEGVLSASFIPAYTKLIAENNKEAARRLASQVANLLLLIVSMLVLAGVSLSPYLIDLLAPGFEGEQRQLCIKLVQIFFPGTGLLVFSAWCLGVLNSHRSFFLSYAAPLAWNAAIIFALLRWGPDSDQFDLAIIVAWSLVVGSLLQTLVMLPSTLKFLGGYRASFDFGSAALRKVVRNFFPALVSRGVVQVSAYVDMLLASLLPTGAVSALAYAQTIYLLPISLFGMAISASELPEMSAGVGDNSSRAEHIRARLNNALERVSFLIIPSTLAFIMIGNAVIAFIYQGGAFQKDATLAVWAVLAAYSVGLLASTKGRLLNSAFYALQDTKTPLKCSLVRVIAALVLGYLFSFHLFPMLGVSPLYIPAGLALGSGLSGWIEYMLLQRKLKRFVGDYGVRLNLLLKMWGAAFVGAALSYFAHSYFNHFPLLSRSVLSFVIFGIVYFSLSLGFKIPSAQEFRKKLSRKL